MLHDFRGRSERIDQPTSSVPTSREILADWAHPERFTLGAPLVRRPPSKVEINPLSPKPATEDEERGDVATGSAGEKRPLIGRAARSSTGA